MKSNQNQEMLDIYKSLLNDNHEMLRNISHSYLDLSQRFPLELGKLITDELKNKSTDVVYTETVMKTYVSILNDVNDLLKKITLVMETSYKIQSSINQKN